MRFKVVDQEKLVRFSWPAHVQEWLASSDTSELMEQPWFEAVRDSLSYIVMKAMADEDESEAVELRETARQVCSLLASDIAQLRRAVLNGSNQIVRFDHGDYSEYQAELSKTGDSFQAFGMDVDYTPSSLSAVELQRPYYSLRRLDAAGLLEEMGIEVGEFGCKDE